MKAVLFFLFMISACGSYILYAYRDKEHANARQDHQQEYIRQMSKINDQIGEKRVLIGDLVSKIEGNSDDEITRGLASFTGERIKLVDGIEKRVGAIKAQLIKLEELRAKKEEDYQTKERALLAQVQDNNAKLIMLTRDLKFQLNKKGKVTDQDLLNMDQQVADLSTKAEQANFKIQQEIQANREKHLATKKKLTGIEETLKSDLSVQETSKINAEYDMKGNSVKTDIPPSERNGLHLTTEELSQYTILRGRYSHLNTGDSNELIKILDDQAKLIREARSLEESFQDTDRQAYKEHQEEQNLIFMGGAGASALFFTLFGIAFLRRK